MVKALYSIINGKCCSRRSEHIVFGCCVLGLASESLLLIDDIYLVAVCVLR